MVFVSAAHGIIPARAGSRPIYGYPKTPNGIIPARAGSSGRKNIRPFFFRDHPRACGEQFCAVVFADCWSGSSPRVRGAADLARLVVGIQGIIPARAGSSHDIERHGILCRDHPRACGEQPASPPTMALLPGSSPRVRGAGAGLEQSRRHRGIIPARAGSRTCRASWSTGGRDHPRACGEQAR